MLKICLVGFGKVGFEFYLQLTAQPGYKELFRITRVQVSNLKNYLDDTEESNLFFDGDYFLFDKDRYDVFVDASAYNPDSKKLILNAVSSGFDVITCNKDLARLDGKQLVEAADQSGSTIDFNAIPSSNLPTKYSEVDLNSRNWSDWADDPDLYIFRGGGPKETAEILVKRVLGRLAV